MAEAAILQVTIKNIVFQSGDGGFAVFRGENREVGTITIVYKGQPPFAGEQVELTGQWTEHPRFGRQFQAASWKALTPTGTQAMIKMLGSGVLTGVV